MLNGWLSNRSYKWIEFSFGHSRNILDNGEHRRTMSSDSDSAKSPGPQYEAFTAWSGERGVTINGVQAAKISGHGLGIVAQRRIEVHQLIFECQ